MHTRRDQVEAHNFVASRMRAALLLAEPDVPRPPLRRTPMGLIVGAVVAVAIAVIAVITGRLGGTDNSWQARGTLIVEQQTATRYVLDDGVLHPVLNYASARLLLGADLTIATVNARQLEGFPQGSELGIAGAPDSLPPYLPTLHTWLSCSGTSSATGNAPKLDLYLDAPATAASASSSEPAHSAVLVRSESGQEYVVEDGLRMRVTQPWVVRGLGFDAATPISVRDTWLNVLAAGPDLGSLPVTGRGAIGPVLGGRATRVGQIAVASSPVQARRYFLVQPTGLQPLGATALALALADPATSAAYPGATVAPVPVSPSVISTAQLLPAAASTAALPALPRPLAGTGSGSVAGAGGVACLRTDTDANRVSTTLVAPPSGFSIESSATGSAGGPLLHRDAATADAVTVPAGYGLVARATPQSGTGAGPLVLVTSNGGAYPMADDQAAADLGYSPASAVQVPPALLSMLPAGPTLTDLGGGH